MVDGLLCEQINYNTKSASFQVNGFYKSLKLDEAIKLNWLAFNLTKNNI